jgi:predicted Abi (CAAX) family protease
MNWITRRFTTALLTIPNRKDWLYTITLLLLYALIYLPMGFKLRFLQVNFEATWQTIVKVTAAAFFMPGLLEELGFRVLLIPHPLENVFKPVRWFWIIVSWLLFVVYHLNPFTPLFFRDPAFLVGAGLLGIVCTVSYLQSGSLWTPVVIHWIIAAVWLLFLGGLEKWHG